MSECYLTVGLCHEFQVIVRPEPEAGEEFVPEPGTMLLVTSGLAGLAEYATLRLRLGLALRWRTRE